MRIRPLLLLLAAVLCSVRASAWTHLYLRSDIDGCSWTNTTTHAFSMVGSNNNDWQLALTTVSSSDIRFRIFVTDDGGKEIYPSTDNVKPTAAGVQAAFDNGTHTAAFRIENSRAGLTYTIRATYSNGWRVSVLSPAGEYYAVFPDENVGNTLRHDAAVSITGHKAFRLTPGRNRNQATLDNDITSLNLKIDGLSGEQLRYDSQGRIRFYVYDAVSGRRYQPAADDRVSTATTAAYNGVDRYGVRNAEATGDAASTTHYYYVTRSDAGDLVRSLTLLFSTQNGSKTYHHNNGSTYTHTNANAVNNFTLNGNLLVGLITSRGYNTAFWNSHLAGKTLYLVGKMDGTNYHNGAQYPMTKLLYKGGRRYEAPFTGCSEAEADSIVFCRTVSKGQASWDDFFLSFASSDNIGTAQMWNRLLRPNVQDEMDGEALEGGISFYKDDNSDDNTEQALNPLLSAEQKARYVAYTVYFNATYSTYRIEFHDAFYIAGAAVSNGYGDRRAMNKTTFHGLECYTYTGIFRQGQRFGFFINDTTYPHNYSEDDDRIVNDGTHDAWTVQAPATGGDYQYHNHVRFNATDDAASWTGDAETRGIVFGLPDGEYTLRFYNHREEDGNVGLYTIDKSVTLRNATATFEHADGASRTENYGSWRTFSDDCALWLPEGVTAYRVATAQGGVAQMVEMDRVPAHCGTLLWDANKREESAAAVVSLAPIPGNHTETLPEGTPNLLVDCSLQAATVSPVTDGKYNYFFTCHYKKKMQPTKSDVPMNFWKTREAAAAKKNYTYLSADCRVEASVYDSNTYTDYVEPAVSQALDYCLRLSIFDDGETTAIAAPHTPEATAPHSGWLTLQGQRIAKPAKPGLYIHDGRKTLIR